MRKVILPVLIPLTTLENKKVLITMYWIIGTILTEILLKTEYFDDKIKLAN